MMLAFLLKSSIERTPRPDGFIYTFNADECDEKFQFLAFQKEKKNK